MIRYRSSYLAPRIAPAAEAESAESAEPEEELTSPPVSESTLQVLASRLAGRGGRRTGSGCRRCPPRRRWTHCCRRRSRR
ncbi:hypothetical protein ACFQ9X_01025 [Catenulispora yoronensis]